MISKHLIYYTLGLSGLTLLFRATLSFLLNEEMFISVWVAAVIYLLLIFMMAYYIALSEKEKLNLNDPGFRFHVVTFLVCNGIGLLWFYYGSPSFRESIMSIYYTLIIWGVFVLFHLFMFLKAQKSSIKGIDRTDIFE